MNHVATCALLTLLGCNRAPAAEGRPTPSASTPIAASTPKPEAAEAMPEAVEAMPDVDSLCKRLEQLSLPSGDMPADSALPALATCNAESLYYGIGVPVDFDAARRCAYAEEAQKRAPVVGGAAILMMVYANGNGVQKNFDLALHFTCRVGGAEAEIESRAARLWRAREGGQLREPFDLCDDITSGFMSGHCSAHRERVAAVGRNAGRSAATANMPKRELSALLIAADRYFQTRSSDEVDQSGTLRASFGIEEQARLEDEFVAALEQLRSAAFPPTSAAPADISATLARIARCKHLAAMEPMAGAITRAGIRRTQARWLAYREAFIALALKLHPDQKREAFEIWLDQVRLRQLTELASGC